MTIIYGPPSWFDGMFPHYHGGEWNPVVASKLSPMPKQMPVVGAEWQAPGLVLNAMAYNAMFQVRHMASILEKRYNPSALTSLLERGQLAFSIARMAPIGPLIDNSVPVTIPVEPHEYVALVDALNIVRTSKVLTQRPVLTPYDLVVLRAMLKDMCRVVGRDVDREWPDDTVHA